MNHSEDIQLTFFKNEHLELLEKFELPEAQAQFTALPEELMNVSEGQYRIVILANQEPVGFFLLHTTNRVSDYTPNPKAILLTALSVDYKQQGKGYAKKAMLELETFITSTFEKIDEVVLAVNHKNIPAQNLYKSVGFQDTGRRKIGKIGEQLILDLKIL
ncbi:GNAT family N-acetyltransferase [Geomicrobium sediminis]|uniref:Ribosomal protein S18 acetylase RimI-like enzyme n=1 Tax=Geomicrobium sediminis TaxID=1347788 RepID=A0ABS2PBG3_9BACL|nr:GNAT family N-acetyltransferase [Geomicrobium sediminis]MBM7632331.1 ribosomal protein S18 acetylase RimI-like enzyme [Geomicrobium sediminis]